MSSDMMDETFFFPIPSSQTFFSFYLRTAQGCADCKQIERRNQNGATTFYERRRLFFFSLSLSRARALRSFLILRKE